MLARRRCVIQTAVQPATISHRYAQAQQQCYGKISRCAQHCWTGTKLYADVLPDLASYTTDAILTQVRRTAVWQQRTRLWTTLLYRRKSACRHLAGRYKLVREIPGTAFDSRKLKAAQLRAHTLGQTKIRTISHGIELAWRESTSSSHRSRLTRGARSLLLVWRRDGTARN